MASKRVLTVGDGDLSFSLALVRAFDIQVVATTWLSAEDLVQRYRSAAGTRDELLERGMPVLHEVDACNLQKLPELGYVDPFDVAMFNFPHLGDVAVDCHRPDSEHVRKHVALLSHFLHSARSVACEVHITLCGEQAALWDLHGSAERLGWLEHRRRAPADVDEFASASLASLSRVPTQASWRCRRKWRNGSLGFVHWASQYGYEHRRHEGEQLMNISNCTTFVFTKRSLKADLPLNRISGEPFITDYQCSICGQEFENDHALALHFRAPALPDSSAPSYTCSQCSRVFLSQRALKQHVVSCSSKLTHHETDLPGQAGYSIRPAPTDVVSMELVVDTDGERFWHFARQREAFRKLLPTKASVKRAIAGGELTLNGEGAEDSRILHPGDVVQLRLNKVREAQDAGAARARLVRVVSLHQDCRLVSGDLASPSAGPDSSVAPWQLVRSVCPPDVAIVWKPSGMRSLGQHAGTLQASLPLVPEMRTRNLVPIPLSRLEIGCSGLSLVALTEKIRVELQEKLVTGGIYHVFRALVHGAAGSPGEIQVLDFRTKQAPERSNVDETQQDGSESSSSGIDAEDDLDNTEANMPSDALKQVQLRVVNILQGYNVSKPETTERAEPLSIVELSTAAECGRCCGSLCHLMRQHGTPVVGDMLARKRSGSQRHRILGGGKRKLQIECVGIWAKGTDHSHFLDVSISRS